MKLDTSGSALVEFAISLPVLLVLGFGVADYGLLMNNTNVLEAATRSGAELVKSNPGTTATDAAMTALFPAGSSISPFQYKCKCLDGTTVAPCPTAPGSSCAGVTNPNTGQTDTRILEYITVAASQNYSPYVLWSGLGFPGSINSTAVARIQ
jgi:hypothetical protein